MSLHPITLADTANLIVLPEFKVGKAFQSIEYPGIRQCFAVVGKRQSFVIGTHVSPGAHADGIADTFAKLRDLGGNWAMDWYVVGPFAHHFSAGPTTAWKSVKDIRSTFEEQFGDNGANHHIADITILRDEQHVADLGQGPTNVGTDYVDIRTDNIAVGNKVDISYRTSHRDGRNIRQNSAWQRLNPWLFKRF